MTYPAATSAVQQASSLYSLQYELEVMVVLEATSCVIWGGYEGRGGQYEGVRVDGKAKRKCVLAAVATWPRQSQIPQSVSRTLWK